MGGGRRLAGEFSDLISSSSSSDNDDASSISQESKHTLQPRPQQPPQQQPCHACNTAYSRARALLNSREAIRRYKPGDFISDVAKHERFEIPETTTLLMIGGSGKSSLVGRIKSVFEDIWNHPSASGNVAAVSDGSSIVDDPYSLQEHMVIKDSTSVCIFDTPGWSVYPEENYKMFQRWMKNGVCHGEIDISDSVNGNSSVPKECEFRLNKKRTVNYVILVLDALAIQESIDTQDSHYLDIVYATFNYPFLSFKGNKPAVVVTNGEQLSSVELSGVLKSIESLLGVPPCQIFNISGNDNYLAELNILNLLRYSLEKADCGLPIKQKSPQEKQGLLHTISKIDGCSDAPVDAFIICSLFLVLFRCWVWYTMGL